MGVDREMSLRLFIGGMRGSRPAIGCGFDAFGGDTTSLLVLGSGGERLILDAGTGMHAVARQLEGNGPGEVTVLFSHYHLDHMVGLTMNTLFHRSDWSFRFVGPTLANGGVRDAVTRLLAPPYWPVSWDRMGAPITFHTLPTEDMQVGHLRVRACPVPHPGGCVAYRIDQADSGASLVFATDIEWHKRTDAHETVFMELCREPRPTDVLIIDAHFDEADADAFAGWGHTCWQDCLKIAESAHIRQIILGHHSPDADDKVLRARQAVVKKHMPWATLARAGQWLTICGKGPNDHAETT